MNNTYQAKNGFKTFLLTLVISLGVFGVVYYITSYPSYSIDIDSHTGGSSVESEVLSDSASSPFAELNQRIDSPRRVVLAGSTTENPLTAESTPTTAPATTVPETTQSTVPDTGVTGMTVSLLVSLVILSAELYYVYLGPRKLALQNFENRILE